MHLEFQSDTERCVHYIREPFKREPDFGVTSVNYKLGDLLARVEAPRWLGPVEGATPFRRGGTAASTLGRWSEYMRIESILLQNYRLFRDARFEGLPSMATIVGTNGSGKSTLFDALSFLKEALAENVAQAVARRGGFQELVSRGVSGPISIILH